MEKQGEKEKNKKEMEKISRKKKIKLSDRNFKNLDLENLKKVVGFLGVFSKSCQQLKNQRKKNTFSFLAFPNFSTGTKRSCPDKEPVDLLLC